MTGWLTTHVLDTARGSPAAGMEITLFRLDGDRRSEIARMRTNADGRTDGPILPQDAFAPGVYELVFAVGAWLDSLDIPAPSPRFLDEVPIRFGMAEASHYHVPLLVSPYGYSTYRGS
ncbi:hydroxyisourate hydrolase [Paracoccus suum]|uniref:5-hydroxyisourate hydrolase n=1 Tax=Paracoccus suum TaxID=2259340 RepID=A0A344PIT7_9RHOB|nr:hydroxyisourate hydrolase [Paracoccus suum]AXC49292.1 hydroxyisourate hydrolase [Paracoccus suum]